jgi:hypothetical protein
MAGNHTNRHRKMNTTRRKIGGGMKTLPELKPLFSQLRRGSHEIIRGTKETKQRIRKFQHLWKELFNRPVDAMASEAYLNIMEKGGDKTRSKTRKLQKGGTAPVDFQTRPGVDGVHGSFPQYLTNGLSFYNTINQEGMFKGCGIQDISPSIPVSMGSNKALGGGGRMFTATVPPSVGQDAENAMAGRPLGLSSLPENNPLAGKYI